MNSLRNKGLSPLTATVFLVVFAIALGVVVMGLGKSYVETVDDEAVKQVTEFCVTSPVSDPLAMLQMDYISGKIDQETYLLKEKEIIVG